MKKILFIFLVLFSFNLYAEWTKAISFDNGDELYIDLSSVIKNNHKVKLWEMTNSNSPSIWKNKTYFSSKLLREYNCKEKMESILYGISYSEKMGYGDIIYENNNPTEWTPIIPDTSGESIFNNFCFTKK